MLFPPPPPLPPSVLRSGSICISAHCGGSVSPCHTHHTGLLARLFALAHLPSRTALCVASTCTLVFGPVALTQRINICLQVNAIFACSAVHPHDNGMRRVCVYLVSERKVCVDDVYQFIRILFTDSMAAHSPTDLCGYLPLTSQSTSLAVHTRPKRQSAMVGASSLVPHLT